MEKLKNKIEKYINKTGGIKTPAYFIKELFNDLIDNINKIKKFTTSNISRIETLYNNNYKHNVEFDGESLHINSNNNHYISTKSPFLEKLTITKDSDTICPSVEFNGHFLELNLPGNVASNYNNINTDGVHKYLLTFTKNNCVINKLEYKDPIAHYLIITYLEGADKLSQGSLDRIYSLDRANYSLPTLENERFLCFTTTDYVNSYFTDIPYIKSMDVSHISYTNSAPTCFTQLSNLESVTIGNNAYIRDWIHVNCPKLNYINVEENGEVYTSLDGILYNKDVTTLIAIPPARTSIEIPNSVTEIRGYAGVDCVGLTSIEIPNSVTKIRNSAFTGCTGLTSIEIPNSVTMIEKYAFGGCSSLTSVQWNVTKCKDFNYDMGPFKDCKQVTSFTFGDNVEHIPNFLCFGMSKLASITIPNSVTSIGSNVFDGCSSLTSITIPNSVTSMGYNVFDGCSSLTSIEIPNSLTSIEDYTFANCSSLPSIIIPNSITFIGSKAFYYCKSLTFITIEATTPPTLKYNSFDFTNNNFIIYVPSESVDAYKKATTWKNYADRIKPMSEYQAN